MKNNIDPDISAIYILVLKHGMKVLDIPRVWRNVQQIEQNLDPTYEMGEPPGYVKMILKYGKRKVW